MRENRTYGLKRGHVRNYVPDGSTLPGDIFLYSLSLVINFLALNYCGSPDSTVRQFDGSSIF